MKWLDEIITLKSLVVFYITTETCKDLAKHFSDILKSRKGKFMTPDIFLRVAGIALISIGIGIGVGMLCGVFK